MGLLFFLRVGVSTPQGGDLTTVQYAVLSICTKNKAGSSLQGYSVSSKCTDIMYHFTNFSFHFFFKLLLYLYYVHYILYYFTNLIYPLIYFLIDKRTEVSAKC